ncbi:DUF3299 domain-containing protein [Pontibacter sp. G13]|uniref:DUF3299 domain-containing protein n=1 Tax=Pontibacter sp. G13 TaxID=3074898 RepID=UPI00288AD9E1|nr:DUF3299 domain-containing protein [Pontibacter sp. G13]WNJ19221.1 DUF3299 domain-containing protein [Pontibacter sp. G13]
MVQGDKWSFDPLLNVLKMGAFMALTVVAIGLNGCKESANEGGEQGDTPQDSLSEASDFHPIRIEAGVVNPDPNLLDLKWETLAQVDFETRYYEEIDDYLLYPMFSDAVKGLEAQEVYISGYVLPVEPGRYVLSANPFSSCFFCGGAGPESVIELDLKGDDSKQIFLTDEWRTFRGTFVLNDSDIDKLNYILIDAVVY